MWWPGAEPLSKLQFFLSHLVHRTCKLGWVSPQVSMHTPPYQGLTLIKTWGPRWLTAWVWELGRTPGLDTQQAFYPLCSLLITLSVLQSCPLSFLPSGILLGLASGSPDRRQAGKRELSETGPGCVPPQTIAAPLKAASTHTTFSLLLPGSYSFLLIVWSSPSSSLLYISSWSPTLYPHFTVLSETNNSSLDYLFQVCQLFLVESQADMSLFTTY